MSTLVTSLPASPNQNKMFQDDQHAANIFRKLLRLYEKEELFDIVLIAGKDRIKIQVHKIVVSALSEYFLDIFRSCPTTSKINEVEIKEIDGSTLKLIIDYMYSGSIDLKLEEIETLLRSAVLLKITNLVEGCCDFVEKNLNIDNCLRWSNLARELCLPGLQDKSSIFIYTNFEEVTKGSGFLDLNKIELEDLLFKNNTYNDLEEQVFLSLVAWIEYEKVDREHLLYELLSMVRYHFLTTKFIIANRKSVCKNFEISEMIHLWLQYHLLPESRTNEHQIGTSSKPKIEMHLKEDVAIFAVVHLNTNYEAEVRSYNPALRTWSLDKRFTPLASKRSFYSLIVINEKLFIVGGKTNESKKSVECLELKSCKSTNLPQMQVGRYDSQLASLNGHLCVFGGFDKPKKENFIASVEIFNFTTMKWSYLNPPIKPNERHKITGHNGVLYIFDFYYGCLQCYDVSANQWTLKTLPIDDNVGEFRIAAVDNFLYAFIGGVFIKGGQWASYKKLTYKAFNLSDDTWCEVGALENDGLFGMMVTIIENKIFFICGNNNIAEYNLETKIFSKIPTSAEYYYNSYIFPLKK